ncbi:hypothetical protein N8940_02300 [Sphingomonadaceae bacterium]|nr:hypothetical protein [Sphingomonadaceae bacterium]
MLEQFPWALAAGCGVIGVAWVANTWLRIKNGYPLDGAWGQALHPKQNPEDAHRLRLLTQENAQLRAEVGSMKDRLANVERIVTDSGYQLTHEISQLADKEAN